MADYAPPTGPPPPHVPPGWKAIFNDQYKEWFYVNTYTKESTWEKPTEEARPAGGSHVPGGPPPYDHSSAQPTGPEKHGLGGPNPGETDEQMARRLQAEESQRASHGGGSSSRGESDSYYGGAPGAPYGQQGNAAPRPTSQQGMPSQDQGKKGLFSKLTGKMGGGQQNRPPQGAYGQPGYGQQPHYGPPPGGQYGGYPPQQQGYGYGQQQGYGGYGQATSGIPPPMGQHQYYQQQQQAPPKKSGMGALGGAGLGLGAGLLGGALIGEAFDHGGGDDGGDYGGDDGGGYGGDDGGGDFGGDGGGDF